MLLSDKISILINSCDEYSDLWNPFFKLLNKYWNIKGVDIFLNTETKFYTEKYCNVIHSHLNSKKYGKRMLVALKKIKTQYVIVLLDDFFIRNYVDNTMINSIIRFMDSNSNIACFNSEIINTKNDQAKSKFKGYKIVPNGTEYIINLQAAIWRTNKLKKYIKKNINPWQLEYYSNILTFKTKDIFYCRNNPVLMFDYGHYNRGDLFGVYRGKWVTDDVYLLFKREHININYKIRGTFNKRDLRKDLPATGKNRFLIILRCLGFKHFIIALSRRLILNKRDDYFLYLKTKFNKKAIK